MSSVPRLPQIPALDGLRAIGIGLVLLTHGAKPFEYPGGFGVDVFFVLSGFLITTLLWSELESRRRILLLPFYAKRAIRLYPALLATVGLSVIVGLIIGLDRSRLFLESGAAVVYLTPLSTVLLGDPVLYGHLWTLAVEEYFYVLWPLALLLMWRIGMSWKVIASLCLIGGVGLYVVRIPLDIIADVELSYARVGGIAIGCGVAVVIAQSRARGPGKLLVIAGVLTLGLAVGCSTVKELGAVAHPLAAVSTVCILFAVMGPTTTWLQRFLATRPLTYIGRISYELYLIHVLCLTVFVWATGLHRYEIWWAAYAVSIILATLMHFAFRPIQVRWRRILAASEKSRTYDRVG